MKTSFLEMCICHAERSEAYLMLSIVETLTALVYSAGVAFAQGENTRDLVAVYANRSLVDTHDRLGKEFAHPSACR